jgi:predicted  nucleic acid-binding Zn-ribbon protein
MTAVYRCTACGRRWSYAAVRHIACCKSCGCGLVREDADEDRAVVPEAAAGAVRGCRC